MFPHPDSLWVKTHKQLIEHHGRQHEPKPIKRKKEHLRIFMLTTGNLFIKLGTILQRRAATQIAATQLTDSLEENISASSTQ